MKVFNDVILKKKKPEKILRNSAYLIEFLSECL